ncbi:MazG-like family protein, partial [Pseudomonas syringae group genomosp. 3]
MSKHPIPGWLRSQFSRIEDEVQKLGPCGVFTQMRTVTQTYFEQQAEALHPKKEPVAWGAPKTVRQLIGQLETLDPELETVALYRLPDGLGKLSGKVKQGHISTSYERMEGIWLGPYKGNGRKVLAFWTKLDPRELPDGEPLPKTPELIGAPELDGLSFQELRQANVKRLASSKYKLCEQNWQSAHWMNALTGEVGECANIIKKVDRGDYSLEAALPNIARELADIQCYLDILAFKLGIDLGAATVSKF